MSIVRLIHITLDPSEAENAVRVWKTECAPLMIQQKGCISEKLLRCRDAHEFGLCRIEPNLWPRPPPCTGKRISDARDGRPQSAHGRSLFAAETARARY